VAAEEKTDGTQNTEMHSSLSVKQDLSLLDASDNSNELSCCRVLSECDEGAEVASATDVLCEVDSVEQSSNHDMQSEHPSDTFQPHESCDLPSDRLHDSHEEPDESRGSPSNHTDGEEFCSPSSVSEETAGKFYQLLDATCKSTKMSLKCKPAEHTGSVDHRHTVAKKLQHKTRVPKASASQLIRTTSGTFVVHDITEPGAESGKMPKFI